MESQNHHSHREDPPLWRQRAAIIGAVAAGVIAVAVIIIASINGSGDNAVRPVAVSTSTSMPGAGRTTTDAEPPGSLSAGRLSAVAAITERPHQFSDNSAATASMVTTARAATGGLAGKIITIDPGHASNPDLGEEPTGPGSDEMKVKDPGGTSGVNTYVPEYMVTLSVSTYLRQMLEAAGATVVMTRSSDAFTGGNAERAGIANDAGSDLFVRVHLNGSTNPATEGASTLYPANIPGWTDDIYSESRRAAQLVQTALVAATGAVDEGIVERSDMTGFNWADVPAILVEAGYLTNPGEDSRFASPEYQQQAAQGIFNGIQAYFAV